MGEREDGLARAREAYVQMDWPMAATYFATAVTDEMTADDLAAYADTQFWLGNVEDTLRLTVAAYDAFLAASRPEDAAMAGVMLGIFHMSRGDEPQAMGWIGRAGRLIQDIPECVVHGYLMLLTEVQANLEFGRPTEAVAAARRMQELGRRLEEPEVTAMGIHAEGRALIKTGHTSDGLALVDEAMVTVLEGRLSPFNSWTLYCFTIEACHEIADLRRMSRWTELTEQWLASLPAARAITGAFASMCTVYRGHLLLLHGEWEEAERTALAALAYEDVLRVDWCADAWYVIAESRRLRGTPGASEAYDEAHARGRSPQPGRALLLLAEGDAEGAARSLRSAVAAAGSDPLRRAPLCAAAVEAAIAAGRLEDAAAAVAELQETASTWGTSGLQAMAATARGALLLAEGRTEETLPALSDACRRWQELGATYNAARACLRLAEAYRAMGDEESAAAERALAEAAFERLGAPMPGTEAPDGLTARECEVLALVAEGRSNRQIGEELFISDRTVARHLTNIFHKIDVESRTQAARYAMDRGLTAAR